MMTLEEYQQREAALKEELARLDAERAQGDEHGEEDGGEGEPQPEEQPEPGVESEARPGSGAQ